MSETSKLRSPRNTTAEVQRSPVGFLADVMALGQADAIETQEAAGQSSFVNSETLPTDIHANGRALLEEFGVKFLGPVEGDSLFQFVELPEGWKKVPTDHAMWSHLVDDKGRERAAIFYKAAFYDRSAHLTVSEFAPKMRPKKQTARR